MRKHIPYQWVDMFQFNQISMSRAAHVQRKMGKCKECVRSNVLSTPKFTFHGNAWEKIYKPLRVLHLCLPLDFKLNAKVVTTLLFCPFGKSYD